MIHPFFRELIPYAQEMQRKTGIPASVALAQAALESGFGKSLLAKEGKNLFGIKAGRSWKGKKLTLPTIEYFQGKPVRVMAKWRKYDSYLDAFLDLARVYYNGLYDDALPYRRNPREFIRRAGKVYATDPQYADKVIALIERYNLDKYDLPPEQWTLDQNLVPEPWYQAWARACGKEVRV